MLRLVIALIRIPRLFLTLFFFPLLITLVLVMAQGFATRLFLAGLDADSRPAKARAEEFRDRNFVRSLIFGDGSPRPPLKVCRWISKELRPGELLEIPPGSGCAPDRLDAALRVADPATAETSAHVELFDGHIDRLHVCRTCLPDIVITPGDDDGGSRTDIYSIWAFLLINEIRFSTFSMPKYVEVLDAAEERRALLGARHLHIKGLREEVSLSGLLTSAAIVLNIAMLVVIALWLALRAHRKVLDYFARSGALLPMVAATGNSTFYGAIWVLTAMRVGAFLLGAVPILIYSIMPGIADQNGPAFQGDMGEFVLWITAICAGLGFASLIASISELKHRHSIVSFTYRYLPLVLSIAGGVVWGATFGLEGSWVEAFRDGIASLPLVGIAPILVAPIVKPKFGIFVIHTLLTTALIIALVRHNSRWFAAHLEDL